MAIQLYKAGDDHVINGIGCEITNCEIGSLQPMLSIGWHTSPGDWLEKEEEKEPEPGSTRGKAKAAGIEGWETKRIKTLEAELDEQKG